MNHVHRFLFTATLLAIILGVVAPTLAAKTQTVETIAAQISGPNSGVIWNDNIVWSVAKLGALPEAAAEKTTPSTLTPETLGPNAP